MSGEEKDSILKGIWIKIDFFPKIEIIEAIANVDKRQQTGRGGLAGDIRSGVTSQRRLEEGSMKGSGSENTGKHLKEVLWALHHSKSEFYTTCVGLVISELTCNNLCKR